MTDSTKELPRVNRVRRVNKKEARLDREIAHPALFLAYCVALITSLKVTFISLNVRSKSFKVIIVNAKLMLAQDFLLVINSNRTLKS